MSGSGRAFYAGACDDLPRGPCNADNVLAHTYIPPHNNAQTHDIDTYLCTRDDNTDRHTKRTDCYAPGDKLNSHSLAASKTPTNYSATANGCRYLRL